MPIQLQNKLARAGKHNASIEEMKSFVQQRCQYAQLLPNEQLPQPSNQAVQAAGAQPKQENQKRTEIDRIQPKKN